MSGLLHKSRENGKILYAIAYRNPTPKVRYFLAADYIEALKYVIKSRKSLGEIDGVAPAIGGYGKSEERKRVYMFGR